MLISVQVIFDHIWSLCDPDLEPSDLKI